MENSECSPKSLNQQPISFLGLPEELIVQILYGLSPLDLLSIGQTCFVLRLISYSPSIWRHVWSRSEVLLPRLEPLSGGLQAIEQPEKSSTDSDEPPIPPPSLDWQPVKTRHEWCLDENGNHPRSKCLKSLRVLAACRRHSDKVVVAPMAVVCKNKPSPQFSNMAFTRNGEILAVWSEVDVLLMDFRTGFTCCSPLPLGYVSWNTVRGCSLLAELYVLDGREGVLLAAPFYNKDTVNVYFQPLPDKAEPNVCPPLIHLKDIKSEWPPNYISTDVLGGFLIVRFLISECVYYTFCTVIDLSGRQPDKTIAFGGLILEIELYDNYLVFAYPLDGSITRVSAVRFNEAASEGSVRITVDDTPHVEFTQPDGGRVRFGSALHHALHSLVIPIWLHEYAGGGSPHAESISRFDITVNEDQNGGVCPAFVRQEGKSILSRDLLQNGESVPSSTPSLSSSGPQDMPIVGVSTTLASGRGRSRLLSVLAAEDSECGTFILTDVCNDSRANDDGDAETGITHRPLFALNDQGALELLTQPKSIKSRHMAFNDLSGRIGIYTCDRERAVYTVAVYEV